MQLPPGYHLQSQPIGNTARDDPVKQQYDLATIGSSSTRHRYSPKRASAGIRRFEGGGLNEPRCEVPERASTQGSRRASTRRFQTGFDSRFQTGLDSTIQASLNRTFRTGLDRRSRRASTRRSSWSRTGRSRVPEVWTSIRRDLDGDYDAPSILD
jgi:hypothetical protein